MAEKSDCSVVLLDLAPRLLKTATRRTKDLALAGGIDVCETDIRATPYSESSFDFVLCEGASIAICGDADRAVEELSRVLKPKGCLGAGFDNTIFRTWKALARGASLSEVIEFVRVGRSPARRGPL